MYRWTSLLTNQIEYEEKNKIEANGNMNRSGLIFNEII